MTPERVRLERLAGAYLEALAARDPGRIKIAPGFRQTENGQVLALGDGIWGTANGIGAYRHVVVDEDTHSIGMTVVLLENDRPVIAGIRLHAPEEGIAESEALVSRSDILFYKDGPQKLDAMRQPAPIWNEIVPPAERMERDELQALAQAYFDTLERNDGSRVAPFEEGCRRLDNGVWATQAPEFDKDGDPPFYALGPAGQFGLGYFVFVTGVRERRVPVIDVDRGVVVSFPLLDHAGTVHEARLTDGHTVPIDLRQPYTWQCMEMFKMRAGRIAQIEVVLNKVPYGMASSW